MYILILSYGECGETSYELEYHENTTEVYKSLVAHKNPEEGIRIPDMVEVAKTVEYVEKLADDELADLIEDWGNIVNAHYGISTRDDVEDDIDEEEFSEILRSLDEEDDTNE